MEKMNWESVVQVTDSSIQPCQLNYCCSCCFCNEMSYYVFFFVFFFPILRALLVKVLPWLQEGGLGTFAVAVLPSSGAQSTPKNTPKPLQGKTQGMVTSKYQARLDAETNVFLGFFLLFFFKCQLMNWLLRA